MSFNILFTDSYEEYKYEEYKQTSGNTLYINLPIDEEISNCRLTSNSLIMAR